MSVVSDVGVIADAPPPTGVKTQRAIEQMAPGAAIVVPAGGAVIASWPGSTSPACATCAIAFQARAHATRDHAGRVEAAVSRLGSR
jgi:hypothetical protein